MRCGTTEILVLKMICLNRSQPASQSGDAPVPADRDQYGGLQGHGSFRRAAIDPSYIFEQSVS